MHIPYIRRIIITAMFCTCTHILSLSSHNDSLDSPLSLSLPSLLASPLDRTQCPKRADESKFLEVGQHRNVLILESIRKRPLKVNPYFSSNASHVLFVLLERLVRWGVIGYTAGVGLWSIASSISWKQPTASSSALRAIFSLSVS